MDARLGKQQLSASAIVVSKGTITGQVKAVLAGDAGDEGFLHKSVTSKTLTNEIILLYLIIRTINV